MKLALSYGMFARKFDLSLQIIEKRSPEAQVCPVTSGMQGRGTSNSGNRLNCGHGNRRPSGDGVVPQRNPF